MACIKEIFDAICLQQQLFISTGFVHNHPSGNFHPSKFDDTLTQTLKKACDLMRIHFLDHVIVCDGFFYSYHDRGRL
ncbi:MAG: hypothetical protein J6Y97_09515 [Prevotella sp.]|nr:hypothetical protein [Prevotella sp.]MBP5508831.1 hypothetical protein [Prevotella sp.]